MINLSRLTKEDLVKVIANLSDGIDWHDGYGFSYPEAKKLNEISATCIAECASNKDWVLPDLTEGGMVTS